MGRGTSKGGGANSVNEVTVQSGNVVKLNSPLVYGDKDPNVDGAMRASLEKQEAKRLKSKIEYGYPVGEDGKTKFGGEIRGGRDGVAVPVYALQNSAAYTHNHPRGKGEENDLGGTFSTQDITVFANYNVKTFRASAAEGTYSISKGKNFDGMGLKAYMNSMSAKNDTVKNQQYTKLLDKCRFGEIKWSDFNMEQSKIFNDYLIAEHNALLAGQKKYGYSYTLERRG